MKAIKLIELLFIIDFNFCFIGYCTCDIKEIRTSSTMFNFFELRLRDY